MTFQPAFFEITAQLIPVLFLALVVEERLQPEDDEGAYQRVMRTFVVVLMFWAEVVCLGVAAGRIDASPGAGRLVSVCTLFAAFLMIIPVVGKAVSEGRSRAERLGHALAGIAFIVGVIVLAVVLGR